MSPIDNLAREDNLDQVRGQHEAQVEKSAGQRGEIWKMPYEGTTDIARQMESRYDIKLKLPN